MASLPSILIATSTPGFGELIRQSLEETGKYRAVLALTAREALTCAREMPFALAILDSDMQGQSFAVFAQALKSAQNNLHLVIIPPDNDLQHPELAEVPYDGYLSKPFYLPDLLDTVAEVLNKRIERKPDLPVAGKHLLSAGDPRTSDQRLDWLQDVSRAAQHLTSLSLASSAQAAMIVRQGALWAYAGQLSQPAAQEAADAVARFWMDGRTLPVTKSAHAVDLVRVLRLNTTGREYILYATSLDTEMVLALAFDAETPFSSIRTQASFLARSLASPLDDKPHSQPAHTLAAQPVSKASPDAFPVSLQNLVNQPLDGDLEDLEGDLPPVDLGPLLDDVPPPNPKAQPRRLLDERRRKLLYPHPSGSVQPARPVPTTSVSGDRSSLVRLDQLSQPQPNPKLEQHLPVPQVSLPSPDEVGEEIYPLTPAVTSLYYVCLMIPRLPGHQLTGDLAAALGEMFHQLCLAFGWRLEQMIIQPDYMQWVTSVPPTTSPSYLMRILRQQTSRRIFETFPALRKENPSGDFWAPGYLIMSGAQLPPQHIVQGFIHHTRQHQGAQFPMRPKV